MRTIEKLWFDSERIWIQTDDLQIKNALHDLGKQLLAV